MQIVSALDVHRGQITFKTLEPASGEGSRGRISPTAREPLREWLERFAGLEAEFVLEGTTGWRFVVEEIERAGHVARLADPAETAARRARKRRAKTDDADCDLQLRLLLAGELPDAWIPPAQILELRTRVRLRKTLIDRRTAWLQRLQAQLFHQGVPPGLKPRTAAERDALARVELSRAGREAVELCLRMLDQLDRELVPIDRALRAFARRQPGCRALAERLYGVGAVTATPILTELGDARRFRSSDDAVRHCGLDVTVWQSDRKRAAGQLSHQGPSLLRWALFEAAQCAARRSHPTTPTTSRSHNGSTTTAPASPSRANSAGTPTTSCANSATTHSPRPRNRRRGDLSTLPPDPIAARSPIIRPMPCGQLPQCSRRQRHRRWSASIDRAAATTRGTNTRSIISSPDTIRAPR
jgi:transposase